MSVSSHVPASKQKATVAAQQELVALNAANQFARFPVALPRLWLQQDQVGEARYLAEEGVHAVVTVVLRKLAVNLEERHSSLYLSISDIVVFYKI